MSAFLMAFCTEHWFWGPAIITLLVYMLTHYGINFVLRTYHLTLQWSVEILHGHKPGAIVHNHVHADDIEKEEHE